MNLIGYNKSSHNKPMDQVQVFGERRSGTNFVEALIHANSNLRMVRKYGWKHGLPSYPVFPARCLFVVVVRNPLDWFKSFFTAPFEAHPEMMELAFPEFLRTEWKSIYTPRKSGWASVGYKADMDGRGECMQLDRHPITGKNFRNLIEMRNIKLTGHLSFLNRDVNAVVVRYEDVKAEQVSFVEKLASVFDIEPGSPLQPMVTKKGPPSPRKALFAEYTEADLDFIRSEIDNEQEKFCGYAL